jgi:hypothetical protein
VLIVSPPSGRIGVVSSHGFVDESVREDRYLLAVTLVDPVDLRRLRKVTRGLLMPGQRELHMKSEKRTRRHHLLDQIVATGAVVIVYTATGRGREQEAARARCLTRLVTDLADRGGQRLVLDSRPGRNAQYGKVIRGVLATRQEQHRLSWEHLDSIADPLIWISDIIGWAHGAGGDWRRRARPAVRSVLPCD